MPLIPRMTRWTTIASGSLDPKTRADLNSLSNVLASWWQRLNFGPIPGAYFPYRFDLDGTLGTGTGQDGIVTPVEFRPIAFSLWVDTGEVTVDVNDDGTSIFASAISTSSSIANIRNRQEFATDLVRPGSILTLDIDSINSGIPTKLHAILWCSQLSQVESV